MGKKLKVLVVTAVIAANLFSFAGCVSLFKKPPEVEPEPPKVETPLTSPDEDNKVKEILRDYFAELYSKSPTQYVDNIVNGLIADNIADKIATRTREEGDANPEIGIHPPRIVDINGVVIVDYEILEDAGKNPRVDSAFIGDSNDVFVYYVKVDLKAKGLTESDFNKYYVRDPMTRMYSLASDEDGYEVEIEEEDYDYIKVRARYDVEVIKEGSDYKILTQREANYKPGVTNRTFILNHDFLTRIPYLSEDIDDEKKIYDDEKALIELYFNNLQTVDKERMNLIRAKWDVDYLEFIDIMKKTGAGKTTGDDFVLDIDENYKNKFKLESFPLKINMERIIKYENFNVKIHPGYSFKNKMYLVSFKAAVAETNGMIGNETIYQYDYIVTMKTLGDRTLIDSVKLSEYSKSSSGTKASTATSSDDEDSDKDDE